MGEDVDRFRVGDEVIVGARGGAYRQLHTVDANLVVPRPGAVSVEQAAALPSSAVAGYSMVENLGVTAEDTIVVHGAAGSVGAATVQIALDRGATVIGTSSPVNHAYLRELGAIPVDYRHDLVGDLRRMGPITAVADAVGGRHTVEATMSVLRRGGRAVTAWGDRHSQAAGIPWVQHPTDELDQTVALAEQGALTVRIGETFPLERASDALWLSKTGHAGGKILLDAS